jgi:hypothetical protein
VPADRNLSETDRIRTSTRQHSIVLAFKVVSIIPHTRTGNSASVGSVNHETVRRAELHLGIIYFPARLK